MAKEKMASNAVGIEKPASHNSDPAVRLNLEVLDRVLPKQELRNFSVVLWDSGVTVPAGPKKPTEFTLILNHPGALRRMFWPPSELAISEAFIRGDYDISGDLVAAVAAGDAIKQHISNPGQLIQLRRLLELPQGKIAQQGRGPAKLEGIVHSEDRDKQAIEYHYNLPSGFYKLFLDPFMQYSCALYPSADATLAKAQENKLGRTTGKIGLKPGNRMLDIGCGFGGLIIYAAQNFDVDATGITLSQTQADYANRWIERLGLAERCRAIVCDYRKMDESKPFDAITSVGMIEHVGRANLLEYFSTANRLLKKEGRFLCHGIANSTHTEPGLGFFGNLVQHVLSAGGRNLIQRYVFPDGELVSNDEYLAFARKAGLELRHTESLREDYALTLRDWGKRLGQNWEEAVNLVDEQTARTWLLYFAGCAHGFDIGRLSVFQNLYTKPGLNGNSGMAFRRI